MREKLKNAMKKDLYKRIKLYYKLFLKQQHNNIPVSGKKYDEKEIISIVDAAFDCCWTEGRVTEQFEKKFNKFLGINHTIVVNSGSSANLLALKTLTSVNLGTRLREKDEIITTAVSFPTTINPIIQCGCVPVFCDIELGTYNIDVKQLRKAIGPRTRAIFLAHTLGNPFNLTEVLKLCKKHGLWLIEDNCDALGSKYKGRYTGTFGDLSTFSFYPAHHITMGEGGAVCTNNLQLAKIARSIRDWGRDCTCKPGQDNRCGNRYNRKFGDLPYGYDHKYVYSEIGYNLKNTDLNVAIGLAQMDKLKSFIKLRQRNYDMLYKRLSRFKDYIILPEREKYSSPSWFGFPITIKNKGKYNTLVDVIKYLQEYKINTRLLFAGNITKQPYFIDNKIKYNVVGKLTNSDKVMNDTFWIGVCPLITEEDINWICNIFFCMFFERIEPDIFSKN